MNVQRGTGTHANYGCPAAGKTGTTDNYNDAWFVGYTPTMATSVWVGYPNALVEMRSVHGISVAGGTFPAQIWHDYMTVAKGAFCGSFPAPKDQIEWIPFYGRYSSSRNAATYGYGGSSAGGGSYSGGYDPRAYAPGLQQKPGGGGQG